MDKEAYQLYLRQKEADHEDICRRCGRCCGADNKPCENLTKDSGGRYLCGDYDNRIGLHKTVEGMPFHCIPIIELINQRAAPAGCAYYN